MTARRTYRSPAGRAVSRGRPKAPLTPAARPCPPLAPRAAMIDAPLDLLLLLAALAMIALVLLW
jgi:hypothetical protein